MVYTCKECATTDRNVSAGLDLISALQHTHPACHVNHADLQSLAIVTWHLDVIVRAILYAEHFDTKGLGTSILQPLSLLSFDLT